MSGTNGLHAAVDGLHINGNGNGHVTINGNETNGTNRTNGTNGTLRVRMARKQSSPMQPAFMVSAPGKVIVWGEHSVVHGKVTPVPAQDTEAGATRGRGSLC